MGPTAAVLLLVKPLAACCASHSVCEGGKCILPVQCMYVLGIMLAKPCQLGQRRGRIGAEEKLSPLKVGKLALTLKKLQSP